MKRVINELDYVDKEIKKVFKGKSYFMGTPTLAQLTKNIKKLTNLMSKPKEYEYKIINKYGCGWARISDEDIELLKDGWELIHVEIDRKKNLYILQMKKEITRGE